MQHLSSAARSNLGLLRALISSLLQTKNCKIRQSPLGSGNLLIIYWFEDSLYVEDQQRTNGWTNICIPWGPVGAKNIITWNYFEWNIYLLPFQTLKTWALRPYIFLGRILASFTLTTAKNIFENIKSLWTLNITLTENLRTRLAVDRDKPRLTYMCNQYLLIKYYDPGWKLEFWLGSPPWHSELSMKWQQK